MRTWLFPGSEAYWESRYAGGGTSGSGSYGRLARFKAEVLNGLVEEHRIESVLEHGCGDGHQLSLATYPRYVGLDVSPSAVAACRKRFADDTSKAFYVLGEAPPVRYDLVLSLDVVYHLVEDAVFEAHVRSLFADATKWVVVYSSNDERPSGSPHVRHRAVARWINTHIDGWELVQHVPNRYPPELDDGGEYSFADFFIFARTTP